MKKYELAGKRVFVAGHRGMVGSALVRGLKSLGNVDILTVGRDEVDLCRQSEVEDWFCRSKPDAVFLSAAKVGGILANDTLPADFIYQNLMIEANIINAAYANKTSKLVFLGSSCIYPKYAAQPLVESALLTGLLEPTNEFYAVAKIAGIKLCQAYRRQHGCDFVSAMPTNLYGINDNFDLANSHVLPALLRKAHEAKLRDDAKMGMWGSGSPLREFMHVDDLASALLHIMEYYSEDEHINVGVGYDISIRDLADIIKSVVGYKGDYEYDASKPDGTPRKLMDSSRLQKLGWAPSIELKDGIETTYDWFLRNMP